MRPEPTPVEVPPIAYAPAAPAVTRRGFRLLLLLTFVNTLLLGLTAAGPTVNAILKQQWADYQARRANRAAEAAAAAVRQSYLPAQQQCLDHLDPPDTLLYAEDPAGIALLTVGGETKRVDRGGGSGSLIRPPELVGLPIGAADPACTANMPSALTILPGGGGPLLPQATATLLFLHERHSVAGPRLVVVSVACMQDVTSGYNTNDDKYGNRGLTTHRYLTVTVARPATPAADATVLFGDTTTLVAGGSLFTIDWTKKQPRVTADYAGLLRLYAGQPDPTDPARFHIPYQYDAHRGTIDGQLTADDHLRLVPDKFLADRELAEAEHPFAVPSPDVRRATGRAR